MRDTVDHPGFYYQSLICQLSTIYIYQITCVKNSSYLCYCAFSAAKLHLTCRIWYSATENARDFLLITSKSMTYIRRWGCELLQYRVGVPIVPQWSLDFKGTLKATFEKKFIMHDWKWLFCKN